MEYLPSDAEKPNLDLIRLIKAGFLNGIIYKKHQISSIYDWARFFGA
jgi:hypothetical protein